MFSVLISQYLVSISSSLHHKSSSDSDVFNLTRFSSSLVLGPLASDLVSHYLSISFPFWQLFVDLDWIFLSTASWTSCLMYLQIYFHHISPSYPLPPNTYWSSFFLDWVFLLSSTKVSLPKHLLLSYIANVIFKIPSDFSLCIRLFIRLHEVLFLKSILI